MSTVLRPAGFMVLRLSFQRIVKPLLFLICLVPLANLIWGLITDTLGANPIEVFTRSTGEWALRFLLITLAVTPVRQVFGWVAVVRFRRMLGLFAFFYVLVHLTAYLWLDQFFDWGEILTDIAKRPFITVGMLAFVLLVRFSATSNKAMMRRLGKRWKKLHRLVYVIAPLAVLHYYWLVKADLRSPTIYLAILLLLLGYRILRARPRVSTT